MFAIIAKTGYWVQGKHGRRKILGLVSVGDLTIAVGESQYALVHQNLTSSVAYNPMVGLA